MLTVNAILELRRGCYILDRVLTKPLGDAMLMNRFPMFAKSAAVLAASVCMFGSAMAIDPDSVCASRLDTVFAFGFEPFDQVRAKGLQDCDSLATYIDGNLDDSIPVAVALDDGVVYNFAVLRSDNDQYSGVDYAVEGLSGFAAFDSEFGIVEIDAPMETSEDFLVEFWF